MTNLDVNVPLQIFLETNGLNSTDDLDHHNIAMGGVSDGYDVYGCLTGAMCFLKGGGVYRDINGVGGCINGGLGVIKLGNKEGREVGSGR